MEDWLAVFHVFGDESGKLSSNHDRTSFCGYVGHFSEWERFNTKWNNCRFRWHVAPIHMVRIMYPDRQDDDGWKKMKSDWGEGWPKVRDAMIGEFSEIVRNSSLACIGAVVDSQHFRLLADKDPLFIKDHKDPIHLAFHTFVMNAIEKTEVIDKHSPISIVIDNDKGIAKDLYDQLETMKSLANQAPAFAKVKERVHALSFVKDDSYPGIQAADMISYEARSVMVKRMTDPDHTSELYDDLTLLRVHQPKFFDPPHLDELYESVKEAKSCGEVTF